jgi:ribosomal protein S18 acetylase RimI-like enzyme
VRENGRGEIGLVAVDERARGRGVGRELVAAVLSDLRARGLSRASVVTQGMNVGAQRLYQSLGFRTRQLQTWHHLWLDELRA